MAESPRHTALQACFTITPCGSDKKPPHCASVLGTVTPVLEQIVERFSRFLSLPGVVARSSLPSWNFSEGARPQSVHPKSRDPPMRGDETTTDHTTLRASTP